MSYRVEIAPAAERQFKKIGHVEVVRIRAAILKLCDNPRPAGCIMLSGPDKTWRIRVGDYCIIYEIYDDRLAVLVVRVGHRGDVYR